MTVREVLGSLSSVPCGLFGVTPSSPLGFLVYGMNRRPCVLIGLGADAGLV
jgi:hypothetical protein